MYEINQRNLYKKNRLYLKYQPKKSCSPLNADDVQKDISNYRVAATRNTVYFR